MLAGESLSRPVTVEIKLNRSKTFRPCCLFANTAFAVVSDSVLRVGRWMILGHFTSLPFADHEEGAGDKYLAGWNSKLIHLRINSSGAWKASSYRSRHRLWASAFLLLSTTPSRVMRPFYRLNGIANWYSCHRLPIAMAIFSSSVSSHSSTA